MQDSRLADGTVEAGSEKAFPFCVSERPGPGLKQVNGMRLVAPGKLLQDLLIRDFLVRLPGRVRHP